MKRFLDKIKVDPATGCHLWTGALSAKGYGRFLFEGKNRHAHRIAWILANGSVPDGLWVLHKCDNPPCVNPDHLFLGDNLANVQDMTAKGRGRYLKGEPHPKAKLTENDVFDIRSSTATNTELARQYGLSRTSVRHIRTRINWRHI